MNKIAAEVASKPLNTFKSTLHIWNTSKYRKDIYRAALDAQRSGRDLCVSWIDLANAYGSVKHSLIHFSLEWYQWYTAG